MKKVMHRFFPALIAAVLLSWSACAPEAVNYAANISKDPKVYTELDRESAAYMLTLLKPDEAIDYNFADDKQYRYYKKKLYLSGVTEETNPQLFKMLESTRQAHLKNYTPDLLVRRKISATGNDDTATNGVMIISSFSTTNPTYYNSTGLFSFPQEEDLITSSTTIGIYNQSGDTVGKPTTASGYTPQALADLEVATQGQNPNPGDSIHASYDYFYMTSDGKGHFGGYMVSTANIVDTIVNQAPMPCVVGQPVQGCNCGGAPCTCGSSTITTVCMTRTTPNCTYCAAGLVNPALIFPMQGYVKYGGKINVNSQGKPVGGFCNVTITRLPSGGGCQAIPLTGSFWNYVTIVADSTLTWNIPQAQFQNTCLKSGDSVLFNMALMVKIGTESAYASITNAYNAKPPAVKIAPIMIVSGCLAEGTMITMSDGKTKAVESIGMLEKIRSDANGGLLSVEYNVTGKEQDPCVRLVDDKGHNVLVTQDHPMMTPGGVVLARRLKPGDKVLTVDGETTLSSVSKEQYNGNVWNLSVGTEADGVQLNTTNSTFYANGFLVGDHKMQHYHQYSRPLSKEEALQRLPAEWHQDYLNSLKKN